MRYLVKLVFFTCVVASAFSRPSSYMDDPENENEEEMEYEGEEEASIDESLRQEDGSRMGKQEPVYVEVEPAENSMDSEEKRDAPTPEHQSKEKSDNSPDYKSSNDRDSSEEMKQGDPYQPQPLQQRPGRYSETKEAKDQAGTSHYLADDKREKFARRAAYTRRNMKTTTGDDKDDELFEDAVAQQRPASDNHQSNNNAPVEQDHEEFFKNYYKTLHASNERVQLEDKNYESYPSHVYRNRRQASDAESLEKSTSSDAQEQNSDNENEETAIKRHIKKLSEQELQSLLDSLPIEKRNLLNQIIESDRGVSKRDITKKAGAVEENNDIDIGILDSNKVHGASVELKNDAGSSGVETTENSKQSEIANVSSPRNTDTEKLSPDKDVSTNDDNKASVNLNEPNNVESKSQGDLNIQSPKLNIKRETSLIDEENKCSILDDMNSNNSDDLNSNPSDENRNYNSGYNYPNEDLSQISDDQTLLDNNILDHVNKREALLENTDSFKSLEESFPNSNTYKESGEYSEIDMVPLVRVKRRNEGSVINKRSAVLVPNSKIAHIPYIAENDNEDSEEGNEFEDDGFYDRSNFAKDAEINRLSSNDMSSKAEKAAQHDVSRDTNVESDTMNIGSDSDSVLSGVEGVDDNLMYNSGARNRRSAENKPTDLTSKESELSSLIEMESKPRGDNLNVVNYQENDAFVPLPQNEGSLSRMKRIRRVKQPCNTISSFDNNN